MPHEATDSDPRLDDTTRTLVLAPRGRDAELTRDLLEKERMACCICSDIDDLCSKILEGAGAVLITQEALDGRASQHLARLVGDLLDVARVTYGKVAFKRAPLELNEVLRGCVQPVEHEAHARGHALTLTPSSKPLFISGDRDRLEQVFGNLLTNAVKYTPPAGTIKVTVERERDQALVRVVDSGVGIESHMLTRVFDLFAQADRSLDRAQGGMGLGLTLVQSLVRLHDGQIEARSKGLGRGSEFRVQLPIAHEESEGVEPETPTASDAGARRIVVVEDHEDIRCMLEELLVRRGHEVTSVSDGPAGVARILATMPDIAFVDVGLPGFDGFEVARQVRSRAGKRIHLVAVTGYGQLDDRARALAAGFDQQLTKPVRLEDIEAAMNG